MHHLQEKFRQNNSGNSWWRDYLRFCYGKTFQPKGIDYLGCSQDQSGHWWDSGHQVRECSTSRRIQTLPNLLRNMEILRSVPDVRIPHMLLRRLIRAGKPWHKSCFWCAKWRNSLESITLRKKVKSIVKNAMQRTLGPKDFAITKEQDPLFMLTQGVNPEQIMHWEFLHNIGTDNLTLNYNAILPALNLHITIAYYHVLG